MNFLLFSLSSGSRTKGTLEPDKLEGEEVTVLKIYRR